MQILVRRAYSGWGYLASAADGVGEVVHGVGFDEAIVEFASKQASLYRGNEDSLRLGDLALTLVHEQYGQYLIEVERR